MVEQASSLAGDEAHSGEGQLRPAVARHSFSTGAAPRQSFEPTTGASRGASDLARALTTGILVIYPVFASAAVVVAGLLLSGSSSV
jgi:hypothetical protein